MECIVSVRPTNSAVVQDVIKKAVVMLSKSSTKGFDLSGCCRMCGTMKHVEMETRWRVDGVDHTKGVDANVAIPTSHRLDCHGRPIAKSMRKMWPK